MIKTIKKLSIGEFVFIISYGFENVFNYEKKVVKVKGNIVNVKGNIVKVKGNIVNVKGNNTNVIRINKMNNYLSLQIIEHKIDNYICRCVLVWDRSTSVLRINGK